MTPHNFDIAHNSHTAQRQALQKQLQQQREEIAHRIAQLRAADNTFPRSQTMAFLIQRPALVAGLIAELTAFVMGARGVKILTAAIFMLQFFITASAEHMSPAQIISALPDKPAPK
jgi:hypothetical protein